MATSDLNILVRAKGAVQAARDIGKVDSAVGRLSGRAGQGLRTASTNIVRGGIIAAGGIALMARSGIQSLADLEDAVTSVDGAISQVGLNASGADVAKWANEIERDVEAAFDDKDIVAATAGLIRYGKVTEDNLRPAMVVMTDLAARTGDVGTAGEIMAKALADPTKAAGKLSRYGIILTKAQQDQIKAMVEAGDVAGAQTLLLDELAKSTDGAAKASAGPYRDALNLMGDAAEDAQRALGEGFLPVIRKVADLLSDGLADPKTMASIREFGQGLANGLDDLIEIARNLPWATIGDSLKLGAEGAKTILSMFSSLPPWVQTAVLTGWGLNKLTGGALGGIVGELGKGLIKGVLGMTAGVVNINAGVVNGGGGVPGAGGSLPGSAGGGLRGAVSLLGKVVLPIGVGILIAEAINQATANDPVLTEHRENVNTAREARDMESPGARGGPEALRKTLDSIGVTNDSLDTLDKTTHQTADELRREHVRVGGQTKGATIEAGLKATRAGLGVEGATWRSAQYVASSIARIPAPVVNLHVSPTTINHNNTRIDRGGSKPPSSKEDRSGELEF